MKSFLQRHSKITGWILVVSIGLLLYTFAVDQYNKTDSVTL
jgi:transposase